jgi:hypothetical protein
MRWQPHSQVRPLWRWKSFWLGVLVLVFLASSWAVSMAGYTAVHWCAVDWWVTGASGGGGVGLRYNGYSGGNSGGLVVEKWAVVSGNRFPQAIMVSWPRDEGDFYVGVAYWFLIAVFLLVWGGFLYWRWRRMRMKALTSMAV